MWNGIIKIIAYITDIIPGIGRWWKARKRVKEVDEIIEIIATDDDPAVIRKLREIADDIERRSKIS